MSASQQPLPPRRPGLSQTPSQADPRGMLDRGGRRAGSGKTGRGPHLQGGPQGGQGAGRAQTFLTGFQSGQKPASRRPPSKENENSAFWGASAPLSPEGVREAAGPRRHALGPGPEGGNRGQVSAARGVGAGAAGPAELQGGGGPPPRRPGPDPAAASTPPPPPNERLPPRRDSGCGRGRSPPKHMTRAAATDPLGRRRRLSTSLVRRPRRSTSAPAAASKRLWPVLLCFCFVLPSNTEATGRRLLAEAKRSFGQSWR